jgi:hypothetical protein
LTNLQACQSFRRLVSPMTGILGLKKSAPWNKRKRTVTADASPTQQTPSKSSVWALYLATLIPKIALLSVHYRTNRRVPPSSRSGVRRTLGAPRRKRKERPLWGSTGRKSFLPRKWLHEKLEGGYRCPVIMGLAGRCERGHEMSFRLDWLYGFHFVECSFVP